MEHRSRLRAFTLIELLVVIAIIALLISMLLPALARSRKGARMLVSLSNIRQLNTGATNYRDDNKGFMPVTITQHRGFTPWPGLQHSPFNIPWCTWQFGGKNSHAWWNLNYSGIYDIEAADRPLNPYVHPDIVYPAPDWQYPQPPTSAARMPTGYPDRYASEAPAFKDPSDVATHQRSWPNPTYTQSSYNDVGTSYHYNVKWFQQMTKYSNDNLKAFNIGTRSIRLADSYNSSRFVWVHDETADVVTNNTDKKFMHKNGYDEINKSIMGFMDGSAKYLPVVPGRGRDSYVTEHYSLLFEYGPYSGK